MVGASAAAALAATPNGVRADATPTGAGTDKPVMAKVTLTVNGQRRDLELDTRTSLLDAAREYLHLTARRRAATRPVRRLHDDRRRRRINACLTLAVMHQGSEITTIEGLGQPDALHPMQGRS